MIKLAIIHFPKGLHLDVHNQPGGQCHAFVTPPFAASIESLPKSYTLSFIDLTLPPEIEQAFLRLVRQHQELENGYNTTIQVSLEPSASAEDSDNNPGFSNHGKALRGLHLMSEFIYSLPSAYTKKPKILNLTRRETEIMQHISLGLMDKEIGARLYISTNTVKSHTKNIYAKMGVKNRIEALQLFLAVHPK